jgi:mono/diheme cytochrome c family protein
MERTMITDGLKSLMITSLIVGFTAAAQAKDAGKAEFQSSCASCHGADGKGKGPVSEQLKVASPDLTILAKKNNGVFPTNAVYETRYGIKRLRLAALVTCQFGDIDISPPPTPL